jgi:peroxiredoxin Q/BCP
MKHVLLLLLVLCVASTAGYAADMPKVGDKAPEFALVSNEGNQVSLKDYKGKWVVLYFYPKNFTTGCTTEAHNFQRDLDKYTAANAVILGVSVDPAKGGDHSHASFCEKEGLHFKTLADESMSVSQSYGSLNTYPAKGDRPEMKLSARNTFIIGPDGKIAKVYEKVNPEPHSADVLAALAELQKK